VTFYGSQAAALKKRGQSVFAGFIDTENPFGYNDSVHSCYSSWNGASGNGAPFSSENGDLYRYEKQKGCCFVAFSEI